MSAPDDYPFRTTDVPADVAGDISPTAPPMVAVLSPGATRFQGCRWRRPAENGSPECCVHRDVLPLAGARGFSPDAWCVECGHFKLRRAPRKRTPAERDNYFYY